ncbi:MAG: uracil-DNA glycosylase [Desulfobacterales bacterium]|nr:MAG: uracil-DNA glycosylase [Desulfobacterales bacterium]UCD91565.1 MAG: uracil-DNA glycosylase [Desulfobacterales bacterium]
MNKGNFAATVEDVRNTLRFLEQMGCKGFDASSEVLNTLAAWGRKDVFSVETLEDIRTDLGDCQRCRLSEGRTNIVFGCGTAHAKLIFIGEGPGYEEDRQGQPFVGAAGQLLTKIIEAIKLTRNQVYICNIVKCRPPGNRNPMPDEIAACSPFLRRQIAAIHPDFICTLGSFAAQTLLETKEPISKLRGIFYDYMGIKVMPTYHPAFLLRNPDKKRSVWEDMKKLMKALGID